MHVLEPLHALERGFLGGGASIQRAPGAGHPGA
jgi:hypothetical protein